MSLCSKNPEPIRFALAFGDLAETGQRDFSRSICGADNMQLPQGFRPTAFCARLLPRKEGKKAHLPLARPPSHEPLQAGVRDLHRRSSHFGPTVLTCYHNILI